MTNENVELYVQDRILAKILLPFIPHWIKPNHVTILRLFLIPFNIYFLFIERWDILIPLFVFTALTDMIDGAMARVRKQITLWGAILDPTADKLLIASVVGIFVVREIHHLLAFTIILLEILIVLGGYMRRRRGEYICANGAGKIKMVLQVFGIGFMFLAKITGIIGFTWFGGGLLGISIIFAIISLVTYGI